MPKEVLEFPLLGQEETYITAGHRYLVVVPNSGPIPVRATSRHHIICQNGAQSGWLGGAAPPHLGLLLCILSSSE